MPFWPPTFRTKPRYVPPLAFEKSAKPEENPRPLDLHAAVPRTLVGLLGSAGTPALALARRAFRRAPLLLNGLSAGKRGQVGGGLDHQLLPRQPFDGTQMLAFPLVAEGDGDPGRACPAG